MSTVIEVSLDLTLNYEQLEIFYGHKNKGLSNTAAGLATAKDILEKTPGVKVQHADTLAD
jgi:hypothetical protein